MAYERARRIADDVLFPAAQRVDAAPRVPDSHLDLLAREGLYGLTVPAEFGGLGVDDPAQAARVVEAMASGCLTTAFVWLQHNGAVRWVRDTPLAERWLPPLARGQRRAGIALGGLLPGPPRVTVRWFGDGCSFGGESPWVTGWSMIDTLLLVGRDEHDTVVAALVDAEESDALAVEPLDLVAANASRTVTLRVRDLAVPPDRVVTTFPYSQWAARDAAGLRTNGSLALGLVDRCCRLMGPSRFDDDLDACRATLDAADTDSMPMARAAAAELAMRAATTLVVTYGGRAVRRDDHAQRLLREAMLLLVFASRPAIRAALLDRLTVVG